MNAEEAIETGGLAAFFLFTALFLSTIDFSLGGSPNTVQTANKLSRFLYAGVMTIAPTSQLAIVIDLVAALIASVGLLQGAKESIKGGVIGAAFLYFFIGFLVNYATAPV